MTDDEALRLRSRHLSEGLRDVAVIAFGMTPDVAESSGFRAAWQGLRSPGGMGPAAVLDDPRFACWVHHARRLVAAGHAELAPRGAWEEHLASFAALTLELGRGRGSLPRVAGFTILQDDDFPEAFVPPGIDVLRKGEFTRDWTSLLEHARAALNVAPEVEANVNLWVAALAPTREWHPETHFSTSSPEAPGVVFLSWSPKLEPFVEALVHEAGHQWLYAVDAERPVLRGSRACRPAVLGSPWRSDPRPLDGVLHGAVAFDRVLTWWSVCGRLISSPFSAQWIARRAECVRRQVRAALTELEAHCSYLTVTGRLIVRDIANRLGYEIDLEPRGTEELILEPIVYIDLGTSTGRAALLELDGLRSQELRGCRATGPLSSGILAAERAWNAGDESEIERQLRALLGLDARLRLAWHRVGELMRRRGDIETAAKLLLSERPWLEIGAQAWLTS